MPSGAKKRKAAKKKKEKEAAQHHQHQPHSVDVHAHGDDDLKHHDDDKDSDAEEVSSPASQEHHNNHHQEEVEKTEDWTDARSSSEENKSFGAPKEYNEATQTEIGEERDIEIEQELEPADAELNSKNPIVEDPEPHKEANGGVLLQSLDKKSVVQNETDSQPASDEVNSSNPTVENVEPRKEGNDGVLLQTLDERNIVQNEIESKPDSDELNSKPAIVENVEPQKEGKDEVLQQSKEERSIVHTETDAKPANGKLNNKTSIKENVEAQKEANDGAVLHSLDQGGVAQIEADSKTMDGPERKNVAVEPAVPLKGSTDGDLLPSQNEESHVIDKKIVLADNAQFVNSIQEVNSFSEGVTQLTNSIEVGEHHSSSMETKSVDAIEKIKSSDEKICGNTSISADSNWETKENGEKEAILHERNGKVPPTCVELGPYNGGNEAIVKRDEILATSDAKISAACEIGEKLTVACTVSVTETTNGADSGNSTNYVEHLKDPEVPKSSDCQPSFPSAPRVVQRTSWMNCCGLFEVFAGSNR